MTEIYVDADACPVRDEVYRVADRLALQVFVVSNGARMIPSPRRDSVSMIVVSAGTDAADDWIAERVTSADVCVTANIPLAARCLAKGARALAPTGKHWTKDNIGNPLASPEVARHRREIGLTAGGPRPFAKSDRARFLTALDAVVQGALRSGAVRAG
jgi:uncharacterized protein